MTTSLVIIFYLYAEYPMPFFFFSSGEGFGGRGEEVPLGLGQQGGVNGCWGLGAQSKLGGYSRNPEQLKEEHAGPAHLLQPQDAPSPAPAAGASRPRSPPPIPVASRGLC